MYKITYHARQQILSRGVTSEAEVLSTIASKLNEIENVRFFEVRVVVKYLGKSVMCSDGSNGDVVLACLDPQRKTIKTVMLQRQSQLRRKSETQKCYVF